MPSALQTEKVAVRFRPEERHGLLESLGPDLQQYSGLGLAMVEKGWHVCLLKPDELKKLSLRLAGMLVTPPASRPIAWLTRAADRVMAAESGLSRKVEQRPREAGLTLAAISLCRPGESFPLPIELAHEAGFQEDNHDRQKEDADISARLHLLLMPYADHPLPELGGLAAPRPSPLPAGKDQCAESRPLYAPSHCGTGAFASRLLGTSAHGRGAFPA